MSKMIGSRNDNVILSEVAGQERLIGLEGLISKHRDTSYRTAGRFDRWGKNKDRSYPAFSLVMISIATRPHPHRSGVAERQLRAPVL